MIVAIILAGGVGSRVGADRPKQFIEIMGKPILAYTTDIFQNHPEVNAIEIVCHKEWKSYLYKMVRKYNLTKVEWIVGGGDDFQESCLNGVNNLKNRISAEDYVLIQYGAAPFTSDRIISDVIRVMKIYGSSFTATPCYQLLGSNDKNGTSRTWIDRDKYIQIACPYGFKYSYLLDIYERAKEQKMLYSVEPHITSLMYALGETLHQAYGNQTNIKITTPEDLDLFEGYLLMKNRKT